ncbi:MAG: hypothetical protein JSV32_04950 [Dehalococcoidia bacterium]|nr:MAG: hypothetical protein JSV32_04950 [Dehalococcoidia bacterium]
MIDPQNITDYDRTEYQLQEFLLFCIFVAGKTAKTIAPKLDAFLEDKDQLPFEYLYNMGSEGIPKHLRKHKMGKYSVLDSSIHMLSIFCRYISLRDITLEQLEMHKGIGPKTSRFFLLHSRPNQKLVVLDTHILKDVRARGIEAPKSTPSGKKYEKISAQYIAALEKEGITDWADFDLNKWKEYAK